MIILFTGGGTGGHVMPIISVAREIKNLQKEIKLHYIGPRDDFAILKKEGFINHAIASGKLRRYFSLKNFIDLPFKIPFSFFQSFFLLLSIKPKLVFSKGGTGSLPVTYCAKLLNIPVFIHESDVSPGLSNRITSTWAKKIFTSFEKTEYFNQDRVNNVGNPIRKELLYLHQDEVKNTFNLTGKKPVILISGGSQGASRINDFILANINKILSTYELIHVSGPRNYVSVGLESKKNIQEGLKEYYHLYEFLNEVQLKNAYGLSNMIISRSGAGNIFEISAVKKPSILIPLPSSANDHQVKNANEYQKSGACMVVEQKSLSIDDLLRTIENVILNSAELSSSALKFSKPEAAENIAKEIIAYVT